MAGLVIDDDAFEGIGVVDISGLPVLSNNA